jgi:HDOD domain.
MEFIGGLLHDFGKLILMQYRLSDYVKAIELTTNEGILDVEAEKKYLVSTTWRLAPLLQRNGNFLTQLLM